MNVGRVVDLLIGFPLRFSLMLVLWVFWLIIGSLIATAKGDWSEFGQKFISTVRWVWNPKLEPDFWPEDTGSGVT